MIVVGSSPRARLATLPPLWPDAAPALPAEAIAGLEASLAQGKLRALVSMATGAGKTYTACERVCRCLPTLGAPATPPRDHKPSGDALHRRVSP